ncbi:hypothetical protein [Hydrogenimonas sp.]
MKIQFDPNLNYQQEAIQAITDLFDGQETCNSNFSVPSFDSQGLMQNETELGYGNKLHLLDEEILENLNKIQLRNGLEHFYLYKGSPTARVSDSSWCQTQPKNAPPRGAK